jgi:hypothetical protein
METRVVNLRTDDYDVYIGRGSKWGNPFRMANGTVYERVRVISAYRKFIRKRADLLAALEELRGKRLGCYCAPKACHGDVLVELLEEEDL